MIDIILKLKPKKVDRSDIFYFSTFPASHVFVEEHLLTFKSRVLCTVFQITFEMDPTIELDGIEFLFMFFRVIVLFFKNEHMAGI